MTNQKDRAVCVLGPATVSDSDSYGLLDADFPRFNLQKRKITSSSEPAQLTSVNSAFLTGLFADVAEAQVEEPCPSSENPLTESSRPVKRSRVSFANSMVRTTTALNFLDTSSPVASFCTVLDLFDDQALSPTSTTEILKVQGGCIPLPGDLNNKKPTTYGMAVQTETEDNALSFSPESPAFPHLPATISATSCNTLTRNQSDLQSSLAEKSEKDSYGWFVEMDEELVHEPAITAAYESRSTTDLAFQAPTPPKAENYDAELEWATAADTVDDVLGDFF